MCKAADWTGFTSGRTAQKQGDLAVGDSLLGEVVVDKQNVASGVTELLTEGGASIGCQILQPVGRGLIAKKNDVDFVIANRKPLLHCYCYMWPTTMGGLHLFRSVTLY